MSVIVNKTALLQFISEVVPNVAGTYFKDKKGCMKYQTQVMSVTKL